MFEPHVSERVACMMPAHATMHAPAVDHFDCIDVKFPGLVLQCRHPVAICCQPQPPEVGRQLVHRLHGLQVKGEGVQQGSLRQQDVLHDWRQQISLPSAGRGPPWAAANGTACIPVARGH